MHYGSRQSIRQAFMIAKPWQRYLIAVAMIAVGAVLMVVGHIAGGFLAVAGVVLLWRMVRDRLPRARRGSPGDSATETVTRTASE
jgi:membrane-bound metal-dependent hydrolase YbcI (DUF457 family)